MSEHDETQQDLPVGFLPTQEEETEADGPAVASYEYQKNLAKEKIRGMLGRTARVKSGNATVVWTVIAQHDPVGLLQRRKLDHPIGWRDESTLMSQPKNRVLAYLFLELLFKDRASLKAAVAKMNEKIKSQREARVKVFSPQEFLICLGLLIGSADFEQQGKKCWLSADHGKNSNDDEFHSLVQHPNFDRYIPYCRFKDFRRFLPAIWFDEERRERGDPKWRFGMAVDDFNDIRQTKICKSQ